MSDKILIETSGAVRTLVLHRPDRKNALDLEMYDALTEALAQAETDRDVFVVRVIGSQGSFCAGNDLKDFLEHPPEGEDSPVMRFLRALLGFTKPLVAAVDGAAVGIGTTMLLHCDLAYASDRAVFKMPFVQLGIVPEAGSTLLVPQLVGHRKAMELLALGEAFGADEAKAMGFVNEVVKASELDAFSAKQCAKLAALPPQSLRLTKKMLKANDDTRLAEVVGDEGAAFMARLRSPEAVEALTAFLEKRKPDFRRFG